MHSMLPDHEQSQALAKMRQRPLAACASNSQRPAAAWLARFSRIAIASIALLPAAFSAAASAQSVRLLVQSSPLAGFRYHEAPQAFPAMRLGDVLELVREPGNPHDPSAVSVQWRGLKLGYVPRRQNDAVAWALDRGEPMSARISRLQEHLNPRLRVEFEVFVE